MPDRDIRTLANRILLDLARELDVAPSVYRDAQDRYDAVGAWLGDESSALAGYNPQIYPQGSFALGTATRPLGDDEIDVDAVCVLAATTRELPQKKLKAVVGDRLKLHGTYARMLDPKEGGRRCWTLRYADASRFHIDILPAIPDPDWQVVAVGVPPEWAKHAVLITDKTTWDTAAAQPRSNPLGYAAWFKDRMRIRLEELRREFAVAKAASVADVPDYELRTPLQRLIQLLKRHRDVQYPGDEDRPISMIITTLAARAYDNQADLSDALLQVVPRMRALIERRAGVYWVPNPVNPAENFADRWAGTPRKAALFFEWLDAVEREHATLLTPSGFGTIDTYLPEAYGQRDAESALRKTRTLREGMQSRTVISTQSPAPQRSRFDVAHRRQPVWPVTPFAAVTVRGRYKQNGTWIDFTSGSAPLAKRRELLFHAETNAAPPFQVYWQIVNTGAEAIAAGQLRGDIVPSATAGIGGLTQSEATLYEGSHWVECFIVQNGRCIARSGEFVVNVQ